MKGTHETCQDRISTFDQERDSIDPQASGFTFAPKTKLDSKQTLSGGDGAISFGQEAFPNAFPNGHKPSYNTNGQTGINSKVSFAEDQKSKQSQGHENI